MKRNLLLLTFFFACAGLPLFAHHGTVEYDNNKTIVLTGTVTDFDFTNPHVLVHIDAPDANGNLQHWIVETAPPSLASHAGWSKNMMKRGDMISYEIHPAKNGSLIGRGGSKVTINGKVLGE